MRGSTDISTLISVLLPLVILSAQIDGRQLQITASTKACSKLCYLKLKNTLKFTTLQKMSCSWLVFLRPSIISHTSKIAVRATDVREASASLLLLGQCLPLQWHYNSTLNTRAEVDN